NAYATAAPVRATNRNRMRRLRSYTSTCEGITPNIEPRYRESNSDAQRARLEQYMREVACRACKGARLKPESLAVTLGGLNIHELTSQCVKDELTFLDHIELTEREHAIAERMLKEIRARLQFLVDVGLDYLALDRA